MRKVTLHERITIRGLLAQRGVRGPLVFRANAKELCHYWRMCFGRPITHYHVYL